MNVTRIEQVAAWLIWNVRKRPQLVNKRPAVTNGTVCRLAAQHSQLIKDCMPNNRKVNGAKSQLSSLVYCSVNSFDDNPDLLNCKNGVVDLRTGTISPHSVTQRFLYCTPVAYKPDADYTKWARWLAEATCEDDAKWLQTAVGYSLTGHTREEILFYVWGKTRSGKGTFDSTLRMTLGGTLAKSVGFSTFTTDRGKDDQNFDLAPLKAARFIAASESKRNERFNEAKVKMITGGDEIHCAFKHKNFFNYVPQFKIWLFSNNPVNADPDDDAVWGRIRVIEFPHSYLGREDKSLKESMRAESYRESVLAWAIQGAIQWYGLGKAGIQELKTNADKKQAQRDQLDSVQMWIDDCCTVDEDFRDADPLTRDVKRTFAKVTRTLYLNYEDWCKENGVMAKKNKGFTQTLDRKGFPNGRERPAGKLERVIYGLTLMRQADEVRPEDLGM